MKCPVLVNLPQPPRLWQSGNPAGFAGFPSGVGKSVFGLFHPAIHVGRSCPSTRGGDQALWIRGSCAQTPRYLRMSPVAWRTAQRPTKAYEFKRLGQFGKSRFHLPLDISLE